jgi:hypothetical protein
MGMPKPPALALVTCRDVQVEEEIEEQEEG